MTRSRSNILPLLCGTDEKLKQTGSVVVLDVLLLTFSVQMSAAYTSLMKYLKQTSCERSVRNYNVSICKQYDRELWENDYIAFDEYYNEPIGRSFGNCEIPFMTS